MRIKITSLLLASGFVFTACDSSEISEATPTKNESKSEFEKEMHFPKDSIDNKTISPTVSEPSKQQDFKKIPTH